VTTGTAEVEGTAGSTESGTIGQGTGSGTSGTATTGAGTTGTTTGTTGTTGTTTGTTWSGSTGTTGTTGSATGTTGTTVLQEEGEGTAGTYSEDDCSGCTMDVDVDTGAHFDTDATTTGTYSGDTDCPECLPDTDSDTLPNTGDSPPQAGETAGGVSRGDLEGSPGSGGGQEIPFEARRRQWLQDAIRSLRDGFIAWDPSLKMRQGQTEVVRVRISEKDLPDLEAGLSQDEGAVVERVPTSSSMIARLTAEEEDAFRIRRLTGEQQPLVSPYTEWAWEVTPLAPGRQRLSLEVVAKFWLSETQTEEIARVKHAEIDVEVDGLFWAQDVFFRYWQWFVGSFSSAFGVFIAWCVRRVHRGSKRRPAGFQPER
jgi:hypothetical protein